MQGYETEATPVPTALEMITKMVTKSPPGPVVVVVVVVKGLLAWPTMLLYDVIICTVS